MAARAQSRAQGNARRGRLFLVVGPSGAGKDTLIAAARARRPDICFPRRVIAGRSGGSVETFEPVTYEEFERRRRAGGFMLDWEAHGLRYGIPAAAARALEQGRDVVVNVSRRVVDEARRRFPGCRVILVTAPPEVLASRLAARGREDAAGIAARLARAESDLPSGPDVIVIDNSGRLEDAVTAFLRALDGSRGGRARNEREVPE